MEGEEEQERQKIDRRLTRMQQDARYKRWVQKFVLFKADLHCLSPTFKSTLNEEEQKVRAKLTWQSEDTLMPPRSD